MRELALYIDTKKNMGRFAVFTTSGSCYIIEAFADDEGHVLIIGGGTNLPETEVTLSAYDPRTGEVDRDSVLADWWIDVYSGGEFLLSSQPVVSIHKVDILTDEGLADLIARTSAQIAAPISTATHDRGGVIDIAISSQFAKA